MYDFTDLACMTQEEIKAAALSIEGAAEISEGNILVDGKLPFVLVAHMDTVYKRVPLRSEIYEKNGNLQTKKGSGVGVGGDDRCGCWVLFQVSTWPEEKRPSLLFCSDEETCAGSSVGLNLLDWSDIKAFIEIDGPKYGVYYSDDSSNDILDSFMSDIIGLHKLTSSYNDIREICQTGCPPGVTLGAAYYNQHEADNERVNLLGLRVVLDIVREICANIDALGWSVVPERKKPIAGLVSGVSSKVGRNWSNYDHYYDYYANWDGLGDITEDETEEESEGALSDRLGYGCDPFAGTCSGCCLVDDCEDYRAFRSLMSEDITEDETEEESEGALSEIVI